MLALQQTAGDAADALSQVAPDETPEGRAAIRRRLTDPLSALHHAVAMAHAALNGPDPEIALLYARDGLLALVRDLTPPSPPVQ